MCSGSCDISSMPAVLTAICVNNKQAQPSSPSHPNKSNKKEISKITYSKQ